MRDHDLELIAALVEGRLEDETEARALIESSSEAREEYESQLRVREALAGLGTASMTESERSALHRDTWTALRSEPVTRPSATPWYATWLPAAAVVALLLGLVGVLSGTGDQQAEVFHEVGSALGDGAGTGGATESTAGAAGEADDGGGDMAPLGAPTTTAAASETYDLAAGDLAYFSRQADRIRAGATPTDEEAIEESSFGDCLSDAGLEDHVVITSVPARASSGGEGPSELIVTAPEDVDIGSASLTFVDAETCQVVYTDE